MMRYRPQRGDLAKCRVIGGSVDHILFTSDVVIVIEHNTVLSRHGLQRWQTNWASLSSLMNEHQ